MTSITPVNTKVPKAKVYPQEIVQAFKELEAIQPPPGFAEYQQRRRLNAPVFCSFGRLALIEDFVRVHGLDYDAQCFLVVGRLNKDQRLRSNASTLRSSSSIPRAHLCIGPHHRKARAATITASTSSTRSLMKLRKV